jgi:signal transduction histidine kinase
MSGVGRPTLMLVEEDVELEHLLQEQLELSGRAVVVAVDAETALRRAREGGIDLIVLDERLPGDVSGLELFRRIKAAGLDPPTILMTAVRDEQLMLRALRAGVRDFVVKTPNYLDYLVPAVERILTENRTERHLASLRETLRQTDRRQDEFLATLAHELRNPLAPILNALHIMRLAYGDPVAAEESRAIIERQVRHMVRLIDDLLDLSRLTRGKIRLRMQAVELSQVVHSAIEGSRPAIDDAGHEITIDLPPAPLVFLSDPTRLSQVLWNLINNAAKYTEQGGHIWVTARQEEQELVLSVRDTGIGISAEMLPGIFEMFSQTERALERSQGGLGIGLSVVRGLVRLHGGSVTAHSAGRGRGSEFVVRLPLQRAGPNEVPDEPPALAGAYPAASARRVLVVDDNVDGARSLAKLLKILGHEVAVTHDGPAALEKVRSFKPEVALMDIGLPGMNGYEVARRLRAIPELREVLLVALTGFGKEEDRQRSMEAGFNAHLVKPVELQDLEALLSNAMA